jgi:hypothetical protein
MRYEEILLPAGKLSAEINRESGGKYLDIIV